MEFFAMVKADPPGVTSVEGKTRDRPRGAPRAGRRPGRSTQRVKEAEMDRRPEPSRPYRAKSLGPPTEPTGARGQCTADATSTQASTLERLPLKFIRFKAV